MIWQRALLGVFICGTVVNAADWPQWRGPRNDGLSDEKGLPTEWSAERNVAWKFKMPGIGAGTPVVWGDKIYATSQEGVTDVIQAGKEFKKLATNHLPDKVFSSPAIAGGRIYLRGYSYLWAIGTN